MLTDPTYLRYIFDGLESQSIHKDNISALPEGLIGIYEEALPQEHNVQNREKFLYFFSTWALLKKEVSALFITELLNWHEQDVIDYLSVYTKWFNSPTFGTYILYHERLRAFLLEKISSQQLHLTNQKIISLSQTALEQRKGDEWEIYALEHLPSHLLISGLQDDKQGDIFKKLVYDTSYWNRQLEISKGYDWSKKMLNQALVWAAKQNTDELIECALNKVDLHNMEQNDAPRIVELVAQNNIETALQRIEAFGGNDKEGLQRKFTLYMLCLMELTLLDSKEKPFRNAAIEKLLNHLDENIPVDHSLLNWNDFFPSYLMFQMACEWAEMGLDYLRVYKRTIEWKSDWIAKKGPFSHSQCKILQKCATTILDDRARSETYLSICKELVKDGKFEEALLCAEVISKGYSKNEVFTVISTELIKQGRINEALVISRTLSSSLSKSCELAVISTELKKQGKIDDSLSILQEAFASTNDIIDELNKIQALKSIATELIKQENVDEIHLIEDLQIKSWALVNLSTAYYFKGEQLISSKLMADAFSIANQIKFSFKKGKAIKDIVLQQINQGLFEQALNSFSSFMSEKVKLDCVEEIVMAFVNNNSINSALILAGNSSSLLSIISIISAKNDFFDSAIEITDKITDASEKSDALLKIGSLLRQKDESEKAIKILISAENCTEFIPTRHRFKILRLICFEYIRLGINDRVFNLVNKFDSEDLKKYLPDIIIEFFRSKSYSEFISYSTRPIKRNYHVQNVNVIRALLEDYELALSAGVLSDIYEQRKIVFTYLFGTKSSSYSVESDKWIVSKLITGKNGKKIFQLLRNTEDILIRIEYLQIILNYREDLIDSNDFKSEISVISELIQNIPEGVKGDRGNRDRIYHMFYHILIESGYISEAFNLAQDKSISINKVIEKYLIENKELQLFNLISNLQEKSERCSCFFKMAIYLNEDSKIFISHYLLEIAFEGIDVLLNDNKYSLLFEIWSLALQYGKRDISNKLFIHLSDRILKITDEWIRNNELRNISQILIDNGLYDDAIKIANYILRDEKDKGRILFDIGDKKFETGLRDEGLELFRSIISDYWRINGLSKAALYYLTYENDDKLEILIIEIKDEFSAILNKKAKKEILLWHNNQFNVLLTRVLNLEELLFFAKVNHERRNEEIIWLIKIAMNLVELNQISDASILISKFLDDRLTELLTDRDLPSSFFSVLIKMGEINMALKLSKIIPNIIDEYSRAEALEVAASALAELHEYIPALNCADTIPIVSNTKWRSESAYKSVIKIIIENISKDLPISQFFKSNLIFKSKWARNYYWRDMGSVLFKKVSILDGLEIIDRLHLIEEKDYLIDGYIKELNLDLINKDVTYSIIKYVFENPFQLVKLIRLYAIQSMANEVHSEEFLERLDRCINIGWALDLKSNFNEASN